MSTSTRQSSTDRDTVRGPNLWFEKLMALVALANLILVFFDLNYIPLRDFWLHGRVQLVIRVAHLELKLPQEPLKILPFPVTDWYDWVKDIEPHRETQKYLDTVKALKEQVAQTGLQSSEARELLQELQNLSVDMIDTNPFDVANKAGTLERIKNRMRDHMNNESAKQSFRLFWSPSYLNRKGWEEEIKFYNKQIQPLIETNFFRHIGETGDFVDDFWKIDIWFIIIFFFPDFLARTWLISRRHTGVSWLDAMLWRWYDIFLLLPFFRWLRVIPVTIRLNQAELINLHPVKKQASQGFVASIAEDLTGVVFLRIINQVQGSIRRGEISRMLSQRSVPQYIDINDTNETAEIAKLMMQLIVYQVLPKIRPDVEALLQYNIEKVLKQSPAYQGIQQLPGVESLQTNLTEQLVKQIYQVFSDTLNSLLEEDPVFDELLERLMENISQTMGSEIQAKQSLERMESLLNDLLEEIKINYVERLSEEDVEEILEQTRALRQVAQTSPQLKSSK
ncbi:MAG: hypothetical protein AB4426_32820 [Xenococcaceae cyanobacterium]